MAVVTRHYGITGPVEFLDVEVERDNRLFVDPRAIRLATSPSPFAADANACTTTFFDEITRCVVSNSQSDHNLGLDLLQQFREPRETRLGYARDSIDGHGGADVVGQTIWAALATDLRAFVAIGLLKQIEDLPIYVDDVAEDRTSDLTTRIVFEPLADFTKAMVAKHPEFTTGGHVVQTFDRQVWDRRRLGWVHKPIDMPVPSGRPLLLVPRDWARRRLLMSSGRIYSTTMLSYVQEVLGTQDSKTGKLIAPPKWQLEERDEFVRGVDTIVRVTSEAAHKQEDLVARFRQFVDQRFQVLTDEEIAKGIG